MAFPGAHQAVLVELDSQRYLVDVGNGAPFFEPIPLKGEVEVRRAGLAYRFRADDRADKQWVQDRLIGGTWEPFCSYELLPPDPRQRAAAYQRHHTPGESWVVDDLTLIRLREDEVWSLRRGQLTQFTADGKRSEPASRTDCARLAAEVFEMPNLPVDEALRALAQETPTVTS
jgi:arylamine N-acetyltransferase